MKKIFLTIFLGMVFSGTGLFAQEEKISVSDKGFFLFSGFGYSYVKIGPDPVFENQGLNGFLGLGYDFHGVNINLLVDYTLLSTIKYQGYGYSQNAEIKTGEHNSIGINLGIKLINRNIFDFTIPIGASMNLSNYKVKHDNEREFKYIYINVESGVMLSWRLSKNFTLLLPFYIGYPIYKTSTIINYTKKEFEPFDYSVGIGLRRTF
jgi:hypothetical protein